MRMIVSLMLLLLLAPQLRAAELHDPEVIASRGGVTLTLADVDAFLQRVPEAQRGGFMDSPKRLQDVLMNMLRTKELAARARSEKLDESALVQREMHWAQDEVLAQVRVNKFVDGLKIPNLDVLAKEDYLSHKDLYVVPEVVNVQHVLITTDKRSDTEARELAERVRQEALADPSKFDALVETYSQDPSKGYNHGKIPEASAPRYARPFAEAAKKLHQPDEISPVVHTQFGYHVMRLLDYTPAKQLPFEQVKDRITAQLKSQYIEKQRAAYLAQIDGEALDANPELIDSLRTRYLPAGSQTPAEAARPEVAAPIEDVKAHKNSTP